ncbi:hypothetical protein WKK05_35115 [Nostoc sp. UHCC 0302]|uniref:hypothetical protein n=1 Tax=Nostoc sp. UHCC 0302 TaxID=3134896 RepID=UPI00311C97FF
MRWLDNLDLLPKANSPMLIKALNPSATCAELAIALLIHYSFDLSGYTANELVDRWQTQYPVDWLHLAVIEALYQGRYKAVSVQQILVFWQRRGQTIFHFNMEFERLICSKFPQSLTSSSTPALPPAKQNPTVEKASSLQLPPAKVGNNYRQNNAPTLQLVSAEQKTSLAQEEKMQGSEDNKHRGITASATRQPVSNVSPRLTSHESLLSTPRQIPPKRTKLLPPAATHPPIGQFTPEKSDRSESFTSKLKAMSGE